MTNVLALSALFLYPQISGLLIRDTGGDTPVPDQTLDFIAVYLFNESVTASDALGTCGADCDLDWINSTTDDTTNKQEGAASIDFPAAADAASCPNADCDEITGISGTISVGSWFRSTDDSSDILYIAGAGNNGWRIERRAGDQVRATIGDGTDTATCESDTGEVINTWVHAGFTTDATNDEIEIFYNGKDDRAAGACPQEDMTSSSADFVAGSTMQGQLDELFIYSGELLADAWCHICSCGIDNFRSCTYSGATYVAKGVNVSLCGTCDLPADPSDPIP